MPDHELFMNYGEGWSVAMLTEEESWPSPAWWLGLGELSYAYHCQAFLAAERMSPSIFTAAASEVSSDVESAAEDKPQEAVTNLKNGWPSKGTTELSALAQPLHHGCILGRSLASLCAGCASAKWKLLCFLPGTPGLEDECTSNDCCLLQEWMLRRTFQSQHWAVQHSGLSTAPKLETAFARWPIFHLSPVFYVPFQQEIQTISVTLAVTKTQLLKCFLLWSTARMLYGTVLLHGKRTSTAWELVPRSWDWFPQNSSQQNNAKKNPDVLLCWTGQSNLCPKNTSGCLKAQIWWLKNLDLSIAAVPKSMILLQVSRC